MLHSLQAKTIQSALDKSGQKHAAKTLRDRIVACESCDILVTKDIKRMEVKKLNQLLLACEDGWAHFPLALQSKIVEHHLVMTAVPNFYKGMCSKLETDHVEAAEVFHKTLEITPCENDSDVEIFDHSCPTMKMVFHSFVKKLEKTMDSLGIFEDAKESKDTFDISEAQKKPPLKHSDCPQLVTLRQQAEVGRFIIGYAYRLCYVFCSQRPHINSWILDSLLTVVCATILQIQFHAMFIWKLYAHTNNIHAYLIGLVHFISLLYRTL